MRIRSHAVLIGALGLSLTLQLAPRSSSATPIVDCPVTHAKFKQTVRAVTPKTRVSGDIGLPMWAVIVNRSGVVCAVAYSGPTVSSQWLLSRQIAAAKAFTSNGLSTSPAQTFKTADLFALVQPGAPLYGLSDGNPVNTLAAYRGPQSAWGTAGDPMVGEIVGGTITFGGGSPLIGQGEVVGGIGVSGDTAARDQAVADAIKSALGL